MMGGYAVGTTHYLNAFASLLGAAAMAYIVLSPRIHEGLAIKIGLVLMMAGQLSTAALVLMPGEPDAGRWEALWNAGLLTRGGILVVIGGYGLRRWRRHCPQRRLDDWMGRKGNGA